MRELTSKHRRVAQMMLWQLESKRLRVVLAPAWGHLAAEGKKLRVVEEQNPAWYQAFCASYTAGRARPRAGRHHDTLIKRQATVASLERLLATDTVKTVYDHRLMDEIETITARLEKLSEHEQEAFWYG